LYYQAWESNKKNYDAVHGLAKCMYKLSKFKTCIDFLTEEFKLEAEKKEIRDYYRMLAICHRKIGEYEKAKEEILFAIKHEPNNPKLAKERKLIERLIEKKKTEDYEEILFESNDNTVMKYIKQDYIHRHTESEEFRILSIALYLHIGLVRLKRERINH